jgi:hypothetical protein
MQRSLIPGAALARVTDKKVAAMSSDHPWWDGLSHGELDATEIAVGVLREHPWAEALLAHARTRHSLPAQLREGQGSTPENASDLFELRFAAELARAGRCADYEFWAGVGNSTVDFRVRGEPDWLIELVSLRTTQAVKDSTAEVSLHPGIAIYSHLHMSGAENPKNTEEYEMLTAISKVLAKASSEGEPTKFPVPAGKLHAVVVDARGYLGAGSGDDSDFVQMAAGAGALRGDDRLWAKAVPGTQGRICGLFEPRNPLAGAGFFRERVHVLGFVAERDFSLGEISGRMLLINNMNLFADRQDLARALATFPLVGVRYLPVLLPPAQGRR